MKNIALILLSFLVSTFVLADEKSLYNFSWLDKDKEVYVLQNRKFRKDGNLYIGATAAKTLSGAFIDAYGGSLRGGYFFSEDWGIELLYGKNIGTENNTAKGVKEQGTVPFYREIDTYMGGMVMWSPFYSKINTFNRIFYFDWMLGAGVANITTLDNRNKFDPAALDFDELTSESQIGLLWNTGFRFYITDSWSVRLDFTALNYKAAKTKKTQGAASTTKSDQIFSNYDLGLGLNYTF
ncbi:MAG TPA: outer membrane beta-barrel domain-containing protein [Bacteriovoracaceae bacterium]|nr:outer membrane beta-barrel domain-containing protein [Bacteriovoracaceae bacterium]